MPYPRKHPIKSYYSIKAQFASLSIASAIMFPSETPGLTSPKAVIETTNNVAPIELGS